MDQEVLKTGVAIVTAIVGLAILSVLVSKNATTLGLVQNLSSGLAQDITAATGPVSGSAITQAPQFATTNGTNY